jgi:hypothetical protein
VSLGLSIIGRMAAECGKETRMLKLGQQIYIVTGTATAHCAVAVSGIHCTVVGETEKAVQLEAIADRGGMTGSKCWLPRKAIRTVAPRERDRGTKWEMESHDLARWFKPTGYTAFWLDKYVSHACLAA